MREVVVVGAGLHRYGVFPEKSIIELGTEAINNALKDAHLEWEDIEAAYCGTSQPFLSTGHQVCNKMGLTGLGITNVENASASGSSAFREAFLSVASGAQDIVLAFGVDKLNPPPRAASKIGSGPSAKKEREGSESLRSLPALAFAALAQHYMKEYGVTREQLGLVSVKSHYNASLNPYAHFQKTFTLEEVNKARLVADPLTVLHCCPWDEGAAAVIVCAKERAPKYTDKLCPSVIASVLQSTPPDGDALITLTEITALEAYGRAGIGPEELDLIELHDAFTIEEIIYSEALGLCPEGQGGRLIEDGTTSLAGKHPINSSGGLISMGHPIGPTGVGQIAEILWQMRGECGQRQIPKPVHWAMAHMVGAGGVCVIHLFKR
ncbi:MAG: thiolase family protein [Deltaproteobacteria bacterium]|nr:thiolase family protein [Deltaproteobacteria bacterium]